MSANPVSPASMDAGREADLIAAAQMGDRTAFLELARHYEPPLYRLVYAMSRSEESAATLVREAYVRAWREIAEYPSGRRFFPWLLRIARALLVKDASQRSHQEGDGALLRAIDSLRPDDRMTLALRVVERLPYSEIAALLDVPTGLVILRIAQARGLILSGTDSLEEQPA